jgi:hypothetical protein
MGQLKLIVNFATAPTNAVATIAAQKFNKVGFVSPQFDDASKGWEVAHNLFVANNFFYTDGCGNNITYKGDLAINGSFGYPDFPTIPDFRSLILNDWDICNHSDVHGSSDQTKDLSDLDTKLMNNLSYVANGVVVPSADNGYVIAGKNLGFAYATAQNAQTFDGIPSTENIIPVALQTQPEYFALPRDFNDEWDDDEWAIPFSKGQIDKFSTGVRNYYILGTHSWLDSEAAVAGYTDLFSYLKNNSNDTLMVCSVREAIEYRHIRALPLTQVLNGNTLTITIDTTNLTDRQRWYDVSLNVTGGTITGVSSQGFTSTSFNSQTGLVNGFKQKSDWSPATKLNVPYGRFNLGS